MFKFNSQMTWVLDEMFTACFSANICPLIEAPLSIEFFNTFAAFLYCIGTLIECLNSDSTDSIVILLKRTNFLNF